MKQGLVDNMENDNNSYIQTDRTSDDIVVADIHISKEEVEEETNKWKHTLICRILGAKPPLNVIDSFIQTVWNAFNVQKVSLIKWGYYLVWFDTNQNMIDAAKDTMPLLDGKPLLSYIWYGNMDLNSVQLLKVPIWVKFIALDYKYWGRSTLFKIASIVGTPVRIDGATEQRDYLGYAKVLIEVDVEKKLPKKIGFFSEFDGLTVVELDYDWRPYKCDLCTMFGHIEDQCIRKKGKKFGDARFESHKRVHYTREQLLELREVANIPKDILKVKQEIGAELFNFEEQNWGRTEPVPSYQPQSRYLGPEWRSRSTQISASRGQDANGSDQLNSHFARAHISSKQRSVM